MANAAARQAAALASSAERVDVVNLTGDLPAGWVETTVEAGVHVHRIGRSDRNDESLYLAFDAASRLAAEVGSDVVQGFYAHPAGTLAVLVGRRVGRPVIVSLRGNDVDLGMFHDAKASTLAWTLREADALTSVSSDLLDKTRWLTGRSRNAFVLHNGVDVDAFSPGEPDAAHLQSLRHCTRPWIGFSGELRFKKGLPLLQELAQRLAAAGAGTVIALGAARRDARAGLEAWRAAEPRAAAHLVEVPYVRDRERLLSWYRAMDLFVFPSFWEGLPNALLESMACGRPVVASTAGAIGEVIEDGISGWLVAPGDVEAFVGRVADATADPASCARIGEGARRRIVEAFSTDTERRALLDVYRQVLEARAA